MKISLLMILERYLKVASGSLYVMFLARYLGAELYGEYSECLAFIGLFGVLSFAGIDNLFQKKLATSKDTSEVLRDFLFIKSIPVIIAVLIYLSINKSANPLFMFFLPFLISLIFSFAYQSLIYEEKFKVIIKISVSIIVISNAFRFYLFTHKMELYWYALSYSLEAALYPLCYFSSSAKAGLIFKKLPSKKSILFIIKEGWPLILSTIIIGSYTKLSILCLGTNAASHEVGRLSLALRFIDAMLIVAVSSSMVGLKKLLNSGVKYKLNKNEYLKKMYVLSTFVSLVCFVCIYYLCPIVFGKEYIYGVDASILTSMIVFFNFVGIYNGRLLVVEGFYRFTLIRNLVAFVLYCLFIFVFKDEYNINISLFSIFIAWFISSFGCMLFDRTTRGMVFFEIKK